MHALYYVTTVDAYVNPAMWTNRGMVRRNIFTSCTKWSGMFGHVQMHTLHCFQPSWLYIYVTTYLWENWPSLRIDWNPLFACMWKRYSCTIKKCQVLEHRYPNRLLQMAYCRLCRTTRMHFSALRALIGLHGVPSCSWQQSWPILCIVSVHVKY